MGDAVVAIRTTVVVFVTVAVLIGTYLHQVARITATAASSAAATAAARTLNHSGWDCTHTDPHWQDAQTEAAEAAVHRTQAASSAVAADLILAASSACTVVASVSVAAAGAHRWLHARAAACATTGTAAQHGWTLPPPC